MKKRRYTQCIIRRTAKVTYGNMQFGGGKPTKPEPERTAIETGACEKPLFGVQEIRTGICSSCAKGWEVPDNKFSSARQRKLATKKYTE